MSDNKRVFWACTAIIFCNEGEHLGGFNDTNCETAFGVQSVGITTTFNLEQVFELGQIGIYENIEEVPDIEVTVEKVLDGTHLLYDLATDSSGIDPGDGGDIDMVARANDRKDVYFSVQDETDQSVDQHGMMCYCSGMYVSSFSYTLPNEGNCTESLTLVGNDKLWKSGGKHRGGGWDSVGGAAVGTSVEDANRLDHLTIAPPSTAWPNDFGDIGSEDVPPTYDAVVAGRYDTAGVQRRENVRLNLSIIPDDIFGVTSNAVAGANNDDVHLNSITINGDLGREAINELGSKLPYYRYVTFPVEIGCDIEVTTISGDLVDAGSHRNNLANQRIYIALDDTTTFDLGNKNKLNSVTYTGASTGGENATVTYSYQGFNSFTVNGPNLPLFP